MHANGWVVGWLAGWLACEVQAAGSNRGKKSQHEQFFFRASIVSGHVSMHPK
jgi:hypothetical protein